MFIKILKNEFKKFEGVPAVRMRNENDFLEALKDHCHKNQPFLFGCDSCSVVTKFYHACRETFICDSILDKMLLITATTKESLRGLKGEYTISLVIK